MPTHASTLIWFRRDLRLTDHPALQTALAAARRDGGEVLPLFVLDPVLLAPAGANRLAYLYACLRSLVASGVPLVIAEGDPVEVVPALARRLGASTVHVTGDFGPYGRRRDAEVGVRLAAQQCRLVEVESPYVVAPGTVLKADGTPYRVFTPFSRAWSTWAQEAHAEGVVSAAGVPWATAMSSLEVPADPAGTAPDLPEAGEAAAADRMDRFVRDHLQDYAEQRNVPAVDATSRLSPDLKYGVIHPRQLLGIIRPAMGTGPRVFISELCWRDFYADVLFHHPHSARQTFSAQMTGMRYDAGPSADERFAAWCEGRTGYPFIDAGMRQLLAEGWMHNRVRMAVASFLVKDLHIDWRRGARWFMEHLVDGDLASNQHGWQWTAGTGTDAAPYFRVFNPVSQGRKFDPSGAYVRRYVPELRALNDRWIHEPWAAPATQGTGRLFDDPDAPAYPGPVVDHAEERVEALARYAELRPGGRS